MFLFLKILTCFAYNWEVEESSFDSSILKGKRGLESADTGQSELGNLVKDPGEDSVDKTGVIFLSL